MRQRGAPFSTDALSGTVQIATETAAAFLKGFLRIKPGNHFSLGADAGSGSHGVRLRGGG